MKLFDQYRGLRKELYILFWGRVVTNMGALIWPMMTLILTEKLKFTSGQASNLMLLVSAFMLPSTMIGGKLADRMNKKHLIIAFDLITVAGYVACFFLPLTRYSVILLAISGIFAQMEWPTYDALVADLSDPEQRERAYSLNYLGGNLGLVLAPTLGGLLFEEHLDLAFLISGLATLSSTVLIFFFVKDVGRSKGKGAGGIYESEKSGTVREIFAQAPVLRHFILSVGIVGGIYSVAMSFLIPLSMSAMYGEKGAFFLGTMTSVNALTVIVGTPVLTQVLEKFRDVVKFQAGAFLEILGCVVLACSAGQIWVCYGAMVIFTVGEVLQSLGEQPYITRRVPASHRGRMSSVRSVCRMLMQGILLPVVGHSADFLPLGAIWAGLVIVGMANIGGMFRLRRKDREEFALLYTQEPETSHR